MQASKLVNAYSQLSKLPAKFPDLGIAVMSVGSFFAFLAMNWRVAAATFVMHILCVVGLCAKKEMGWIAARRIVAYMANVHAVWYRSISKFPSNTAGDRAFVASTFSLAHREVSVSMRPATCLPLPAFVRAAPVYLFPETFFDWALMFCSVDVAGTIANRLAFDMPQFGIGMLGNRCKPATAAMAVTIGDFCGWIVGYGCEKRELWGTIIHVDTFLSRFGLIRERFAVAARSFYSCHSCKYSIDWRY